MNLKMFTEDEKAILRSLRSPFKWIARDADGALYVYDGRPERCEDVFVCRDSYKDTYFVKIAMFKHIFKGVTFENSPIRFRAEVLDEVEKAYLRAVLSPFRKRIDFVVKRNEALERQYIEAVLKDFDAMSFPFFRAGTMYKGMEVGKRYSLEDLGIRYD